MATRKFSYRVVAEQLDDTGLDPSCVVDTDVTPGPLTQSGWKAEGSGTVVLAAAAADQAITFAAAASILIWSVDNPFGIRLAAGETLLSNQMVFLAGGHANVMTTEIKIHPGVSVLLSGNGTSESIIKYKVIEKP